MASVRLSGGISNDRCRSGKFRADDQSGPVFGIRLSPIGGFCYLAQLQGSDLPKSPLGMVRAAGERIPMNNSIWKVLTALGVAGIGVFFVIQVQGRLAAQKKNDPQAAVAAAESPPGAAGAAAAEPASAGAVSPAADESLFSFGQPETGSEIRTASFKASPADPPAGNGSAAGAPPDDRFFSNLEEPAPAATPATEAPSLPSPESAGGAAPITSAAPEIIAPPAVGVSPVSPVVAAETPAVSNEFPAAAAAPSTQELQALTPVSDEPDDAPAFVIPDPVPDMTEPAETPAPASEPAMEPEPEPEPFPTEDSTPRAVEPQPADFSFSEPADAAKETNQPEPVQAESAPAAEERVSLPPKRGEPDFGTDLPSMDSLPADRGGRRIPSATETSQSPALDSMRPHLSIQKLAPKSATVGVPIEYRIIISNQGDLPAYDLQVEDELGASADLISTSPQPDTAAGGVMRWRIPELASGASREITVRVRPTGEGTMDGAATVSFSAQVRSATVIRSPKLQLKVTGPSAVKLGSKIQLQFRITNNGTGDASNVVLRSVLPPAVRHPEGADLEYSIDVLKAGETEVVDLAVAAAEPGDRVRLAAEIEADGTTTTTARTEINIVGSQLVIERTGPGKRYVNHPTRFQNIVRNQSQFEAVGASVVEQVPEGMRVESLGAGGKYDPKTRQIRWELPTIDAGRDVVLDLTLVPESTGRLESRVAVIEASGFRSEAKDNTVVNVEGIHNVKADISRQDKPVAIGERFGFTVTIDNRGTAEARNVQISLQVPAEIEVLAAGTHEVPGKLMAGNVVRYDKVVSIRPNEQMKFQVTLRGNQITRNAVVQAQLKYEEMDRPLIVSESVTVYDDKL